MKKFVIFVVLVLIVIVIVLSSLMGGESAVIYTNPYSYDSDYLKEIKSHEKDYLSNYNLIDTAKQIYSIPIDSAILKYAGEN